ncbi:MAG TPA: tetratricopeptide repeat protein, partial [Candidatus Polarisedimenticolia bacterium]|nr:tetratricopeptide repeat protein [Candidatus Polarisedimenticolia bacterium]
MGKRRRARRLQKEESAPSAKEARGGFPPLPLSAAAERRALILILALGLIVRIGYLLEYRLRSIFYGGLMLDAQVYDEWARRIAAGDWWTGKAFYHAPLYPYLLAVFYRVLGHRYLPVYLCQLLLGLANLFLVYRIGRRCASAWVGLSAACLLLVYPALLFFETKLMSTTLAVFLCLAALWLLTGAWEAGGWKRWLAAGAAIGVAGLAHPASLLLAPVFAAARLLKTRRLGEVAALAAGACLAVAPATLHNWAAGGGFVLVSSQGGTTFLQGNTPASRGLYRPIDGFTGSPLSQEEEEKTLAERESGRPLKASEISGFWFRKGATSIADQPGRYLDLLGFKLLRLVSSHEYSTEYSLDVEEEGLLTLRFLPLPFGFLLAGAAAGALLGRRVFPRLTPIFLYLLAALAPPMIFYVSSRYRIAAAPGLAILAGVALERLGARLRAGAAMEAVPVFAVIVLAGGLTLFPYGRDHLVQEANVHYNVGNLYSDRGEYPRAIAEFERAIAVSDFEFYRINLGNALARTGRFSEAVEQYRQVSLRKPGFAKAYVQWAKALLQQGRTEEAREQYRKAVALGMRNEDLERKLGTVPGTAASPAVEIDAVQRALAADPENAALHNSLGVALQKARRTDEAEAEYRKAASLDPRHEKSRFNLGLLFEKEGRFDEALSQ